jgi:hypothetical protein
MARTRPIGRPRKGRDAAMTARVTPETKAAVEQFCLRNGLAQVDALERWILHGVAEDVGEEVVPRSM